MNEALEWLPTTRAILNSCQEELAWNTDIARCQDGNQAAKAIKEAEVSCAANIMVVEAMIKEAETHHKIVIKEAETCCATKAHDLEQSHEESVL